MCTSMSYTFALSLFTFRFENRQREAAISHHSSVIAGTLGKNQNANRKGGLVFLHHNFITSAYRLK